MPLLQDDVKVFCLIQLKKKLNIYLQILFYFILKYMLFSFYLLKLNNKIINKLIN